MPTSRARPAADPAALGFDSCGLRWRLSSAARLRSAHVVSVAGAILHARRRSMRLKCPKMPSNRLVCARSGEALQPPPPPYKVLRGLKVRSPSRAAHSHAARARPTHHPDLTLRRRRSGRARRGDGPGHTAWRLRCVGGEGWRRSHNYHIQPPTASSPSRWLLDEGAPAAPAQPHLRPPDSMPW